MRRQCDGCDGYGEDVSMGETCEECGGSGVVAELTPRQALEALGFRFEPVKRSRGKSIDVVAPGGVVSWRERATWPDSPEASAYVRRHAAERAEWATRERQVADAAEARAVKAEAEARAVQDVAGRVRR